MNPENTILYFWNASCSVCEPLYEKLEVLIKSDFPELSIKKIDLVTNPELRSKYQVFSSPLIVLLLDGKEFFRSNGNVSLHQMREKIGRLYHLKFDN